MMRAKVNGKFNYNVEANDQGIMLDDKVVHIDTKKINSTQSNIIYQYKSYNVELVEQNRSDKTFSVKVNGTIYQVEIEDQYDQLLKQLGLDYSKTNKVAEVKAPMPGLVLSIMTEEGKTVVKGDNLLVLEAMKMENMIKSPSDGVIKRILIKTGDKIDKNAVLIQFE